MNKKIYMKSNNGVDTLLKAVSTLRRKEFDVVEVSLQNCDMGSDLFITVNASETLGFDMALSHMKKLFNIAEIKLIDEN
jgi:hypothetical protein